MESKIQRMSRSVYVIIGSEGATNFGIVKANDGSAVLIDADIRRIGEVEEIAVGVLPKARRQK
jgi:hypothetical protein